MAGYVKRKRSLKAEINVVPYIDVMLVLLIIFMVTSPFVTQGVEVELPKTQTAQPASEIAGDTDASFIIVEIDKDGNLGLSVNDEDMVRGLSMDDVIARVKAERKLSPLSPVAVGGDSQTPYADVVLVLDQLNQAGVEKVGLLTEIQDNDQS
ncbi:MAG: protein TolR [Vibrio sp.]